LKGLITANTSEMTTELLTTILEESANTISDADIHLAHLSIGLATATLSNSEVISKTICDETLPRVLKLAVSPLLTQANALASITTFLKELLNPAFAILDFDDLLKMLLDSVDKSAKMQKQSIANLAKCIASIISTSTKKQMKKVIETFIADIEKKNGAWTDSKQLALLAIGDLGEVVDLASFGKLDQIILSALETGDEETKSAAAYSLGHIAVSSMDKFLPEILSALSKITIDDPAQKKLQENLLSSLKELISCYHHNPSKLEFEAKYKNQILPLLFASCAATDEGVRAMVAECLGLLCCLEPGILSKLADTSKEKRGTAGGTQGERIAEEEDKSALSCWTMAAAAKIAISNGKSPAFNNAMRPLLPVFLSLINEEDVQVKKATILLITAGIHFNARLIVPELAPFLPTLYELVVLKMERTIDLGPFKHVIDDALPLRKATLGVFNSAYETCPDLISLEKFLPLLGENLSDDEQVRILTHQFLVQISAKDGAMVSQFADTYVAILEKQVTKTIKESAQAIDKDRANDQVRSALRAVFAISRAKGISNAKKFCEFMVRVKGNLKLKPMLAQMQSEIGVA
jgi:cullin-associated NEDD8-dissociated protein 1